MLCVCDSVVFLECVNVVVSVIIICGNVVVVEFWCILLKVLMILF